MAKNEYTPRQELEPMAAYIVNDEATRNKRILHLMADDGQTSACGRATTEGTRMKLTMAGDLRHRDYRFCTWCDNAVGADLT